MKYLTKCVATVLTTPEYRAVKRWARQQKMSQSAALRRLIVAEITAQLAAHADQSND